MVHVSAAGATRGRQCVVARFTRQQMMDMGLLPPPNSPADQTEEQFHAAKGAEVVGEESLVGAVKGVFPADGSGEHGQAEEEEGETPEPIGLIGHFEARALLGHKDTLGPFVGSLDMSMTERELISTQDGVGE